jgi:hypothetical protein
MFGMTSGDLKHAPDVRRYGKIVPIVTAFAAGARVGSYELLVPIGAGGSKADRANALVQSMEGGPVGPLLYHLLGSDMDAAARWYCEAIEQHEPFAVLYARASLTAPLGSSVHWPGLARMMNL